MSERVRHFVRLSAVAFAFAVFALSAPALRAASAAETAGVEFFENKVRPVLVENCYQCHSADAKKVKGGLLLDTKEDLLKGGTSGVAVIAGDPDKSPLIQAIRYDDKDLQMPPNKDGGKKLSEVAIADLATWVKMGAPYAATPARKLAAHPWSFEPVKNPPAPAVKRTDWAATSIDPFILAKIEALGLQPAPPADPLTLIRRMTFDLTGLPPTPEEVDAFIAEAAGNRPQATAHLVDRLLASPSYGERWGRHWLDLVRYADTAGETGDFPVPLAWRYRNYVIDAFNADRPYDEFVREQIAGDIIARTAPRERYAERVTATGFLAISRRFGFDSENYHHLTIQDTIDTLGQTVLGLSLGCARCHDHKFDPISLQDYYGLYGIFESSRYAFPGSEQKKNSRSMVPLLPPEESQPKWQAFDARVAALADKTEGKRVPAILRSLDDPDGDFEMQAPAAGGSNGVLVAPWLWDGKVGVTGEAQSPFKNLYPLGKNGARVSAGVNDYRIAQAIYPPRPRAQGGQMHVNLDFRVAASEAGAKGVHRFWIGARNDSPALEVLISSEAISLRNAEKTTVLRAAKPGEWNELQLTLDLGKGTAFGTVGKPGDLTAFSDQPLSSSWSGTVDFAAIDSRGQNGVAVPALDLDNFGTQTLPIPPVTTTLAAAPNAPDAAALTEQLQKLTGLDGDFELQADGASPAKPWAPGPQALVKISGTAQSPFRNIFGAGKHGAQLPNSGAYDGFILPLGKAWKSDSAEHAFVSIDFRCASKDAGGDGAWRFYLGHNPGASPAVELFVTGGEFFRRSGDGRDVVGPIRIGEWYQVQLALDLKARTYTGVIATATERREFSGDFATGWDGTIDTTFVDSYGHRGGVRPALDVDNFTIRETALPPIGAPAVQLADAELEARRAQVMALRQQLAAVEGDASKTKQELDTLLCNGPCDLTYGVVEGTPHNARVQLRGEPDRPGPEAPRGFIKVLGGGPLPPETEGSGRLELAQWITRADNPLTARVMVNRIWQYHFGHGLVATPNDFGVRGQLPTHPELLDHLATEFMKSGWSIKAMHRLMMLSATYQQAVAGVETAGSYTGFPRSRLSAEELRDSILAVSGELDRTPGREHPFPAPTTWGFSQHGPFSAVYDDNKRSVYLMSQRLKRHPFLALFDGADPNTSTPDRRTTTVPTQALFFLNDPFVFAKAEKCAVRLRAARTDDPQRIELAWRLAIGRAPTAVESAEAVDFLASYRTELAAAGQGNPELGALAAYVRVLFGSNEFLHLD